MEITTFCTLMVSLHSSIKLIRQILRFLREIVQNEVVSSVCKLRSHCLIATFIYAMKQFDLKYST